MAKFTQEQMNLAQELSTRKDTSDDQRTLAKEIISRASEQKPQTEHDVTILQDAVQAAKELPTNAKIGFIELGGNAIDILASRGVQFNDTTARALGFSDEEISRIVRGGQDPNTQRERVLGEMTQFATDPTSEVGTHPLGFVFGLAQEFSKFRSVGQAAEKKAQNLRATLPEATFGNNFITKSARSVMQSGVPSAVTALGVTLLTGQPAVGLAVLGETEQAGTFFEQLESGASVPKASLIAGLSEAAEIATESLVFPKIFKGIKGGVSLRQGINLVMENAGQEAAAGFSQTFLQKFGILTTQGMDKDKAAVQAYNAGIKAIPENAWVGALTTGGTVTTSSAVQSVFNMTSKARKASGQEVSRAPGSPTEETTPVPPTPAARDSRTASIEPILDNSMESRSSKTTAVDNQRDIAEGTGLDSTIKPSDVLAAETVDQVMQRAEQNVARRIDRAFLDKNTTEVERLANLLPENSRVREEGEHLAFVLKDKEGRAPKAELTEEERTELSTALQLIAEKEETQAQEALAKETQQKAFQIKKLQSELGLNDRDYRKALYETTQKNSTVAMSLTELDQVITDLNFKKSKKYLADEPVRLKLTEQDLSEIKGSVANIGDDVWRTVLTNQQYALPADPFSHKKMFNVLKTKVRKQQAFLKRQTDKGSPNVLTNEKAHAAERTANFFGAFTSYRNFFSDLDQQTGIPVFGRYQNLIDSSATAKADANRAFANVLEMHGMTKAPKFSKLTGGFRTVNRLNKALYFAPPADMKTEDMSTEQLEAAEIIDSFTPDERNHYDTLRDLFNSDPARPNTGPNAVRLRGYQWRVWNRAYNEFTPQISEAQQVIDTDQRQINNLIAGNENLQQRSQRLQEVDQEILEVTQAAIGLGEFAESTEKKIAETPKATAPDLVGEVTQPFKMVRDEDGFPTHVGKIDGVEIKLFRDTDQFGTSFPVWAATEDAPLLGIKKLETIAMGTKADAIRSLQDKQKHLAEALVKESPVEIKGLEKEIPSQQAQVKMALLIRERGALETEISQLEETLPSVDKKRISGLKRKISKNKENITKWNKNIKQATPITGTPKGKSLTDPKVLQAGKKAQQEGRLYDWLGQQTFGTKEIYFVGEDKFNTWFKSVADSMKPGELGGELRAHAAELSDTATQHRVKVGDPLLNKNPYGVAKVRLTKLSLLDELFSPVNDMNQDIRKAWDQMSPGQTKAYSAWMDNMVGVYNEPGGVVKSLQVIQKQWWRAYGWNPQRMTKFVTRNVGQISLVSSQVSVPRYLAAMPVGMTAFHMQAHAARAKQQGHVSELDKLDMQDLQNQLRTNINKSTDRVTAVADPWLYDDWRQFANTEVSQKAAQYALLTQQENTRTGGADLNLQDAMPSLMGVSDTMGRWATWVPLHQLAFSNMQALRAGKIGDKQLWSRLSLDTLENPQKDTLMALKENGQDRQFIRQYANMKTKNVHYAYDLNERTPIEQSAASRSLLGVITWPRSAMENYVRMGKNGVDGLKEGDTQKARTAAFGMIKYMAGFGVLGVLSAKAARDPWYGIWRSINPVGFVGSPQLTHLQETAQVLGTFWDGDLNNLPSQEKSEAFVSELVDKLGVLALPSAVGLMEGWKTMVEAEHGLKGVKTVDLMQATFKGKSELYMGSQEAYRTEEEKWLKFFFNEEKQESRETRRIPGL